MLGYDFPLLIKNKANFTATICDVLVLECGVCRAEVPSTGLEKIYSGVFVVDYVGPSAVQR